MDTSTNGPPTIGDDASASDTREKPDPPARAARRGRAAAPPLAEDTRIQSKLPVAVVDPFVSITRRQTCVPDARLTPGFVTVVHVCQPPVFGTLSGPVLSTPSTSTWNVPPAPSDATLT